MVSKRVNVRAILADPDLRRKLMVSTIQATQAREGIDTTPEQASRAYYVVTESERAVFLDLERFKGGKRGERDTRHEMFVRSLRSEVDRVRHDVARRDFAAIAGSPLAYERVWIVAPIFRETPSLEPEWAIARQGKATGDDPKWVRFRWEVLSDTDWVPFAKGGDYSRFFADVDLVLNWKPKKREELKASGNGLPSEEHYFKAGLTWPRRTQRGFNVRIMPSGCVFADKGPALFPESADDTYFLLGLTNSAMAEFILQGLTSFGSWEVGAVRRLPVPRPSAGTRDTISSGSRAIYEAKREWGSATETSSEFVQPWLVRTTVKDKTLPGMLAELAVKEAANETAIRKHYLELNEAVYRLYGIPDVTRAKINQSLGERPPEVLWVEMEGKSTEQKRMEHVWRLLSFAVKRVIEADDNGIVPFSQATGETRLAERVRHELAGLFPERNESQLEVEIVNELRRSVRGYKRCASIDDWLANIFFEYHANLYKNRPIFWHIASSQGTGSFAFGAIVHYHRFDKNGMAKLRATYIRDTIDELRRETGLADKAGRADDRIELQAKVEEAQTLDKRLQWIQEGRHEGLDGGERDYRILTPWKDASTRPRGWDPDLDDGVKVNIAPLERAGVLRVTGTAG
jgi:hypothetical protein